MIFQIIMYACRLKNFDICELCILSTVNKSLNQRLQDILPLTMRITLTNKYNIKYLVKLFSRLRGKRLYFTISPSKLIYDEDLTGLANLPLRSLDISGTNITDGGLVHLKDLPLKYLYLSDTNITGDSLVRLKDLPLRNLDLSDNNITGDSLVHLKDLPLRNLYLSDTKINDDGLVHLKNIPLTYLDLRDRKSVV